MCLRINKDLGESIGGLEMTYSLASVWDMIQKSELQAIDDGYIENKNGVELINIYLSLLIELLKNNPEKQLIIFENIDHMISVEEYKNVVNRCTQIAYEYDLYFMFTTSLSNYVTITDELIEGITVFNDEVFTFPEIERVCQYINDNYPFCKVFDIVDICIKLEKICHKIGKVGYLYEDQEMVICKLLNDTIIEKETKKTETNLMETHFLEV